MESLSDAQVLLLAAQLIAAPNLGQCRILAARRPDVLSVALLYRLLLTYLPWDTDAEVEQSLISLLADLDTGFENFSALDSPFDDEDLDILPPSDAEHALSSLKLEKVPVYNHDTTADLLSDFVIAWTHHTEASTGHVPLTLTLVDAFTPHHTTLQQWAETYLRPLCRLQSVYAGKSASSISLDAMEKLHGQSAVALLLQPSVDTGTPATVGRDLDDIVAPWVRGTTHSKRRRLSSPAVNSHTQQPSSWQDVNEWLLATSRQNYRLAAATVSQWNGPSASDSIQDVSTHNGSTSDDTLSYAQTILALIYLPSEKDSDDRIAQKKTLLQRAATLAQLIPPDFGTPLPTIPDIDSLQNASRSDLLDSVRLSPQNILTQPSSALIDFLHAILTSQTILNHWKIDNTTRSVVNTVLFEPENKQQHELRNILNQIPRLTRSNSNWHDLRAQLRWLQTWSTDEQSSPKDTHLAYLGRLERRDLELQIVDAMLAANEFQSLKDIYLGPVQSILTKAQVQEHVITAILNAYDNASNGNRTRGGVKKASDLLAAFRRSLEDESEFVRLEHLIKATHSLSFYQLTLQHGVPFQPVNIRVSNDPLSLIEKVLDQNNKAYTKLDDLLEIARNLVRADLPTPTSQEYAPGEHVPLEHRLFDAEHRITYSAIKAALIDHDFNTAYSLITTRLSLSQSQSQPRLPFADDTSWRAAYAAGKYRPSTPPVDIHKRIASLSKRMELLSTALILAPNPEPLSEILATWRRGEEEMDALKSQALEEERALDAHSDNVIPGGFGPSDLDLDANETRRMLESRRAYNTTGPSYEEEAPMGLFDVARGAASALRKNAFPLSGAQGKGVKVRDRPRASMEGSMTSSGEFERPGSSDGQRVRKRDMLSSAVTGGLVSGMSWVLGTQPVAQQDGQEASNRHE